ncbi:MAG: hypothetical protein PHH24_01725 [Candidatus Moranbacteria bacterium]|jgi:hypothetical protein|nr:hypothetical protein [Candidatus Moranbacteria bacterium]MDD5652364.1 hypothetical protein [Candidatus Moranbacteria bacterium]MDX9855282.1 hypothetical protein [Candidatus Moranbacteria bacterium]
MENYNKVINSLVSAVNFLRNYDNLCQIIPSAKKINMASAEDRQGLEEILKEKLRENGYFI